MKYLVTIHDTLCEVIFGTYQENNRVSIELYESETGEPYMTASVNMPDHDLKEDEVAIKNYSENEGIIDILNRAGIVRIIWKTPNEIYFCQMSIPENEYRREVSK